MQANALKTYSRLPWTNEFRSEFPTHHARSYLKDKDFAKLQDFLFAEKHVDFRKAKLITKVLKNDMGVVKNDNEVIVTINLPFVEYQCVGCKRNLCRVDRIGNDYSYYIEAIRREIEQLNEIVKKKCYIVKSVCFTGNLLALGEEDMKKLLGMCQFPLSEKNVEIGNPIFMTEAKLKILSDFGVEHLIFNTLTFNTVSLRKLCRHFTLKDFISPLRQAKQLGFLLSFELVVGLFDEQGLQITRSIHDAIELGANSVELFSRFCPYESEIITQTNQSAISLQRKNLDIAFDVMSEANFEPYFLYCTEVDGGCFENVGYALNGGKSKYLEDKKLRISTELACGCDVRSVVVKHQENEKNELCADKSLLGYVKNIDNLLQKKEKMFLN